MALSSKQESAELVVLSLLAEGEKYGYMLSKEAAAKSDGKLRLTPGVLYPLLRELEAQGLITSSWEEVRSERSEAEEDAEGRKRKWYRPPPRARSAWPSASPPTAPTAPS